MQLDWPRTARRLVPLTLEAPPLRPLSDFPELPTNFGEFEPRGVLEENGDRYRLFVTEPKLGRDAVVWVYHKSEQLVSERRRSVARPTRGRWLTGGTTDDWHWDAFLRGPNTTLADVVRPGRPLGWPETQGILDQVATELVLSRDDAPMIGPLSADRILLRPDGRVQLTDRLPGEDGPSEQRDLAFLASIARLALEGHLPTGGEERNPVRARHSAACRGPRRAIMSRARRICFGLPVSK